MASSKHDRRQLGIDPEAERTVEAAARASHLSVSAFVLQVAELRAEEILAERPVIHLSPEAAEAFAQALERPPEVNRHLAEALGGPRCINWIA